jgi:hypothetical protein
LLLKIPTYLGKAPTLVGSPRLLPIATAGKTTNETSPATLVQRPWMLPSEPPTSSDPPLACCTSFQLQRTRMGVDRRRGAATRFTLLARRLISGIEPSPPPSIMNIPCQCIGRRRDVYIREAEDLDRTAVFILARGRPWLDDDMPPQPPGTSYPGAVCQIPFWSSTGVHTSEVGVSDMECTFSSFFPSGDFMDGQLQLS